MYYNTKPKSLPKGVFCNMLSPKIQIFSKLVLKFKLHEGEVWKGIFVFYYFHVIDQKSNSISFMNLFNLSYIMALIVSIFQILKHGLKFAIMSITNEALYFTIILAKKTCKSKFFTLKTSWVHCCVASNFLGWQQKSFNITKWVGQFFSHPNFI